MKTSATPLGAFLWRAVSIALLVLAVLVGVLVGPLFSRKSPPACIGLACDGDADCGSRCVCDTRGSASRGVCVEK